MSQKRSKYDKRSKSMRSVSDGGNFVTSLDLITNLPTVNRYDSILVVVDQGLSKGVILSPCTKTITWEGIAELL